MESEIKIEKSKSTKFLNGLRGLAALYVMIGHSRSLLWEGYSEGYLKHPETYTFIDKIFLYIFSAFRYGHIAVILFFVLSGFVIHYNSSKNYPNRLNNWEYFLKRFFRIYPPLLFSMIITFILDYLGKNIFNFSIYFGHSPSLVINEHVHYDLSFLTGLGNIFMVQGFYVPVWGTNAPLWSLSYEWWFYFIYPILFLLHRKNIIIMYLSVLFLFILGIYSILPFLIVRLVFSYFLCWNFGVFLADTYRKSINFIWILIPLLLILVLKFFIFKNDEVTQLILDDLIFGFIFCSGIFVLLNLKNNNWIIRILDKLNWLGNCSYTLYIIHYPVLVFISGFLLSQSDNHLPKNSYLIIIGSIVCTGIAYMLHFILERSYFKNGVFLPKIRTNS